MLDEKDELLTLFISPITSYRLGKVSVQWSAAQTTIYPILCATVGYVMLSEAVTFCLLFCTLFISDPSCAPHTMDLKCLKAAEESTFLFRPNNQMPLASLHQK